MKTATQPNPAKTQSSRYNPGTVKAVAPAGYGCYWVDSFTNPEKSYWVDLNAGTCTCEDHQNRHRACKHIREAKIKAFTRTCEKAEKMTVAQLKAALAKNDYRPEIRQAIQTILSLRETPVAA